MKMKFTVLSGIFAAALLLSACGASLKEAAPSTAAAAAETVSEDNTGGMSDTAAPSESESDSSLSPCLLYTSGPNLCQDDESQSGSGTGRR